MAEWLQKLGPISVVAIVFTWCCWPYITDSAAIGSKEAKNIPILSKSLLSPTVKSSDGRDPFAVLGEATAQMLANAAPPTPDDIEKKTADAAKTTDANSPRQSLVLSATYLQGGQGVAAIIDGKIYRPGQTLAAKDAAGNLWTVKQILADQVVLKNNGGIKVITYADPDKSGGAGPGGDNKDSSATNQNAGSANAAKPETNTPSNGELKPISSLSDLIEAVEAIKNQKP